MSEERRADLDFDLMRQILDNLKLQGNQLQIYLQRLFDHDSEKTFVVLCQILSQSLQASQSAFKSLNRNKELKKCTQQKQKIASSINFLIEKSFKANEKNPDLWGIYVRLLGSQKVKDELGQWGIIKVLERSIRKFLQSFQQQFNLVFQQLYFKLNCSNRIVIQSILPSGDIDQANIITFFKETLSDYIQMGIVILKEIKILRELDRVQWLSNIFYQYLQALYKTLLYLNCQSQQSNEEQLLINKICSSQDLEHLVESCIFIRYEDSKATNLEGAIRKVLNFQGTFRQKETYNNIVALGLQIFCVILSRYSRQSGLADFDSCRSLFLMENMIPSFIGQISQTKSERLNLSINEKLTIGMICLIKKGIEFIFMNNFFWGNYKDIFWSVVYPLLITSSEQKRQFNDDPEAFIGQAQTLVQKEEDDPQKLESVKTYTAFLLQKMAQNIDGSLSTIVNQTISLIQYFVLQQKNQISRDLIQKHKLKPNIEVLFTILVIFSSKLKQRQDLLMRIRFIFIQNRARIFDLRDLEKSRMLHLLVYNFDEIFRIPGRTTNSEIVLDKCTGQYYDYIAFSLEESQIISKICLTFFQTYCDLQRRTCVILNHLTSLIETTKNIDVFQTISKTLGDISTYLEFEEIKEILIKCVNRTLNDNKQYINSIKTHQNFTNICMIKCLGIIRKVGLMCKDLGDKGQELMAIIWRIFQLFQFIQDANYAEDLIKIFDVTLSFVSKLQSSSFYEFLESFAAYHKKNKEIGRLFYTYLTLLMKGEQYLKQGEEGANFLNHIVDNIMIIIRYCFRDRSMIAVVLLQYILVKFPGLKYEHQQILEKTKQILELRNDLSKQNRAAIYNLWILGSSAWQGYTQSWVNKVNLIDIYGYHAQVFGFAILQKVKVLLSQLKEREEEKIEKIIWILRMGVKFLQGYEEHNKDKKSKVQYRIEQFSRASANEKIRQCFFLIKDRLSKQDYQYVRKEIQLDIDKEKLITLLSKVRGESRVIFKFKNN